MLKEIFHDSFENFEITRICMENHANVTGRQNFGALSVTYLSIISCI